MKTLKALAVTTLLAASLSGCVAYDGQPYPYMGGAAPYYGTTYVPAYAYGEVGVGGYYNSYHAQHIHSGYNNGYWHHQYAAQHGGAVPHGVATPHGVPAQRGGGAPHSGGHEDGHH